MARRLLVIANETVASPRVVEEVVRRLDPGGLVRVVAPIIHRGRLDHFLDSGDVVARSAAEERLSRTMQSLEAQGVQTVGQLGDSSPQQALDDAMRTFGPDHVIVATHPPGRSRWLERGIVDRARRNYPVPVTHLIVDVDSGAAEVRLDPREEQHAAREELVPVFYSAPYEEALGIRREGFRAVADHGMVPVTRDAPPQDTGVVFAVRVPAAALAGAEAPASGGRIRVPVAVLDASGPPVEADDGFAE